MPERMWQVLNRNFNAAFGSPDCFQWHVYFVCCFARSVKRCVTTLRTAAKETIVMYACFGLE